MSIVPDNKKGEKKAELIIYLSISGKIVLAIKNKLK